MWKVTACCCKPEQDSRLTTEAWRGVVVLQYAGVGLLVEIDVDNDQLLVTLTGLTQFPQNSDPLIIAPASTLFPGTALIGATDGAYRRARQRSRQMTP